ncbi:MAG: hypothetical protein LBE37_16445 [Sphingobacterium sp.]|jgi:hypothetical protein|nr:hypothetical protein [Sphingobacterium sp.]
MKNIDKIDPFDTTVEKTNVGVITTLLTEVEISAKDSISFGTQSLLTNYVYKENESYNLVYTAVSIDGSIESFVEEDGILPTQFLNPDGENYISLVPYHPDKELEISIPVFNRENIDLPKGNRPFVGEFIGVSNQFSIFYDIDFWSDTKPDKMLAIEFKNGELKKKHNIKVQLPRNNKIFIENNEIHLLTKEGNSWLHRQIDEKGNEIRQRRFKTSSKSILQTLSLSFDKSSYLLVQDKGKISMEIVYENGENSRMDLIDIKDPFFNTWRPTKIAEDTFVTRFNGEFGNGWFTTKNDVLLEIFYSKGEKGYKNLLTEEVLELKRNNLVISSINKTQDNSYAVVLYPMTEGRDKNRELMVLNRGIE